jgi:hypothetical protein
MRVGHVFIVVGAVVVATLVAIIAAFAITSEQAIDKAFFDGVRAEIGLVREKMLGLGGGVKSAAKTLRAHCAARNTSARFLPVGPHPPTGSVATQLENFTATLELMLQVADSDPAVQTASLITRSSFCSAVTQNANPPPANPPLVGNGSSGSSSGSSASGGATAAPARRLGRRG